MFYDESKSPYQYTYGENVLEVQQEEFDIKKELEYLSSGQFFRGSDFIMENYIKLYNSKEQLLSLIFEIIPKENVKNISIGGSYLIKKFNSLSDIDINVITNDSFFSYIDIPSKLAKKKISNISNKVSLMILWEDLFNSNTKNDFIFTPNYLHRDLAMREGLVWSYRNINLYGTTYRTNQPSENFYKNIKVRLLRQLKFAELVFDGLFDHYNTEDRIISKMASRIGEAGMIWSMFDKWIDYEKYYNIFLGNCTTSPNELFEEIKKISKLLE